MNIHFRLIALFIFCSSPSLLSPPLLSLVSHPAVFSLCLPSHPLWYFSTVQVRSCNLTCAVLAGFDFAVGLLLHCLLIVSHLLQSQPCVASTMQYSRNINTDNTFFRMYSSELWQYTHRAIHQSMPLPACGQPEEYLWCSEVIKKIKLLLIISGFCSSLNGHLKWLNPHTSPSQNSQLCSTNKQPVTKAAP